MNFTQKDIEWLSMKELAIDDRVQRQYVRMGHAEQIAANFDPDAFGSILVSRRKDKSKVVLDGQHRLKALEIMGWNGTQSVPCEVHDGLSLEQEARLFRQRNTAVKPNKLDSFFVRLTEGDPVAINMAKIAGELGWTVPRSLYQATAHISAVETMEAIYTGRGIKVTGRDGEMPDALRLTLKIITDAWGHDARGVVGSVLRGIGSVARRDGKLIDQPTLSHRLAQLGGGPDQLIGMGRSGFTGTTITGGIAASIIYIHNKGKRSRILPPWPV